MPRQVLSGFGAPRTADPQFLSPPAESAGAPPLRSSQPGTQGGVSRATGLAQNFADPQNLTVRLLTKTRTG